MNFKFFTIFKEKPGIISPDYCWVGYGNCRLFVADRLHQLIWQMIRHWNDDHYLVG